MSDQSGVMAPASPPVTLTPATPTITAVVQQHLSADAKAAFESLIARLASGKKVLVTDAETLFGQVNNEAKSVSVAADLPKSVLYVLTGAAVFGVISLGIDVLHLVGSIVH